MNFAAGLFAGILIGIVVAVQGQISIENSDIARGATIMDGRLFRLDEVKP